MGPVVWLYRLSNFLWRRRIILLPDLIGFLIRIIYSADIHYQASIGKNIVFSHNGLGAIIHPRAKIGDNVVVGAHVVIGCNLDAYDVPRIGNNVFIGPGAKILGDLDIGNFVFVGANSVVLSSVPDRALVAGAPAKVVRYLSDEEIAAYWTNA